MATSEVALVEKNNSLEPQGNLLRIDSVPNSNQDVTLSPSQSPSGKEDLKKQLPYYVEFAKRKDVNVLKMNDYKDDPEGYLQAILKKYNVNHPKVINTNDDDKNELRPWVEGTMEKLLPQSNMFGMYQWRRRLFRLFDEVLVWFEEPSDNIVTKLLHKPEPTMKPLGIIPLALITSLRAPSATKDVNNDSNQNSNNVVANNNARSSITTIATNALQTIATSDNIEQDDLLLQLELQIGDEGIILLRCSDYKQRIKWYECLHAAIFNIEKPIFTKLKGIWRIAEEEVTDSSKQIMSNDINNNGKKRNSLVNVRMGPSLVLTFQQIKSVFGMLPIQENNNNDNNANDNDDKNDNDNIDNQNNNDNNKIDNDNASLQIDPLASTVTTQIESNSANTNNNNNRSSLKRSSLNKNHKVL